LGYFIQSADNGGNEHSEQSLDSTDGNVEVELVMAQIHLLERGK